MGNILTFTGGIAATNGYAMETPTGWVVVDAPEGMADWLKGQGIQPSALLLTHQHFDHCQDAAKIKKTWQCPILAFSAFSRELTLEFLMAFASGSRFEVEAFEVDTLLEGKAEIDAAGLKWKLAHVPGHSLDSVTFYQEELGLLFGGDVLFAGGIGRTDFPHGSMPTLLNGIREKVLTLPAVTTVLPGHGEPTTVGEETAGNPFLR